MDMYHVQVKKNRCLTCTMHFFGYELWRLIKHFGLAESCDSIYCGALEDCLALHVYSTLFWVRVYTLFKCHVVTARVMSVFLSFEDRLIGSFLFYFNSAIN